MSSMLPETREPVADQNKNKNRSEAANQKQELNRKPPWHKIN